MATISIIVPIYKVEKYVEDCVRHLTAQTCRDVEILLVDDGSPDNSGAICDRLAATDSRIRVLHKPNGGVSSARNLGLEQASGDYVVFCDADDYPAPDWCEKLLAGMELPNADLAVCEVHLFTDEGVIGTISFPKDTENGVLPKSAIWPLYTARLSNGPWNKMYRKRILDENGLRFDTTLKHGEDFYFILKYIDLMPGGIAPVKHPLYYYRQDNAGSATSKFMPAMWEQKKVIYALFESILQKYSDDYRTVEPTFNSWYADLIASILENNMLPGNPVSTKERIAMNSRILRDPACRNAVKKANTEAISKRNLSLMKLRTYLPIYLIGKLRR